MGRSEISRLLMEQIHICTANHKLMLFDFLACLSECASFLYSHYNYCSDNVRYNQTVHVSTVA